MCVCVRPHMMCTCICVAYNFDLMCMYFCVQVDDAEVLFKGLSFVSYNNFCGGRLANNWKSAKRILVRQEKNTGLHLHPPRFKQADLINMHSYGRPNKRYGSRHTNFVNFTNIKCLNIVETR